MSEQHGTSAAAGSATVEVVQAVYDRVSSYEESATTETIRQQLDEALAEAGVDLDEDTRDTLVRHIDDGGGREDVATLL